MLLSIIVPVYNSEKYLIRCLNSIYNQGLNEDDFELLMINDGSTDGSMDIMLDYVNHHRNARIISKENEGISATRNRGIQEAIGDYIYMPDSDDYLIDNGLSYLISNYLNDDIDVLMFYMRTVSPNKLHSITDSINGQIVYDGTGLDLIKLHINFSTCNLIIRSDILKNRLFKTSVFHTKLTIGEDSLFNVELLLSNPHIRIINSSIYRYITNPASLVTTRDPQRLIKYIESYVYLLNVLQKYTNSMCNKAIKNSILNLIEQTYTPFTSRLLSSNISLKKFKTLIRELKDNNITKPNKRVIKALFTYPILLIPARWAYKYCFVPFILPIIKRHNA